MKVRRLLRFTIGASVAISVCAGAATVAFEAQSPGYGPAVTFQIALGDLDGDGDQDAVFANQGETPSRVLLNDGTGTFAYTDQRLTPQGHGAALGDLDGDGDLDLVIVCASFGAAGRPSRVYLNDGRGVFADAGQSLGDERLSGNLVEFVDIDDDGDLDVFIGSMTIPDRAFVGHIFANDGRGGLTPTERDFPFGTRFADLDGDGDADAFAKEAGVGYRAWINDGSGAFYVIYEFADPAVWYEPCSFTFGDLDEDGDLDVLDTNGSWTARGPAYILRNDGTGRFERSSLDGPPTLCAWPALDDVDRDGHLDASVTCMGEPDRIWLGDGGGDLTDSGLRLGGNLMTTGHAAGDLDGDGDIDLFIPVYGMTGGMAVVWLNESP
jgi:hypothetical protein